MRDVLRTWFIVFSIFSGKLNEMGVRFPEVSNQEKCVKCGNCMIYCPDFAMVVTDDE